MIDTRFAITPSYIDGIAGDGPVNGGGYGARSAINSDEYKPSERKETEDLHDVIRKLPKVDLHRHLEGSLTPEMMVRLADKYGITLPSRDPEELRPHLQVMPEDKTLLDFLKKFDTIGLAFKNEDAIKDITEMVIQDAAKDNIKYLELRFSPIYMAGQYNLPLDKVMDAVAEGTKKAAEETGTKVNLIVIVERQMGIEKARVAEQLAEQYMDRGVVALDLANDEFHYPPGPYAEVFQDAKAAGLKITVHAGEAGGADNVKTSIEQLKADRIGHGVRTFEDPAVEQMVRERGIPLELNPTSNIQTGAVAGWELHPLKRFHETGIEVTINTDDPGVSGIDLSNEYEEAMTRWGLSRDDVEDIIINGVEAAFLPEKEKAEMAEQFRKEFDRIEEWNVAQ